MPWTIRKRIALTALICVVSLIVGVFVFHHHCPTIGFAITSERREYHRLKNRNAIPNPTDFDDRVTLSKILEPGEDQSRWSGMRAARVEGYVVSLANARLELTNCLCDRDIHIHIGLLPDAAPREQMVLEVTPRMRRWARLQGWDWSEETLRRDLLGKWCRFEGWMFFDSHHAKEAENMSPGVPDVWRATAWEIHPVTRIEVLK